MSLSLGNWRNSQEEVLTETTELPLIGARNKAGRAESKDLNQETQLSLLGGGEDGDRAMG